jgi:hypothetical protein
MCRQTENDRSSCDHGSEHPVTMEEHELLHYMSDYQLLKNYFIQVSLESKYTLQDFRKSLEE